MTTIGFHCIGIVWVFSLYVMLDGLYGSENVTNSPISIVVSSKMSEIFLIFTELSL